MGGHTCAGVRKNKVLHFCLLQAGCAIFWIIHLLYLVLMVVECWRPQLVEALDAIVEEGLLADRWLAGFGIMRLEWTIPIM